MLFVREVLGAEPDDWQEVILREIGRDGGVGIRKIKIESCHGPGKTALMAWVSVYAFCCRFPQKTAATAPTGGQMYDAFYAEVKTWLKKLPPAFADAFEVKSDRIEFKAAVERSFLSARTAKAEQPEALQGVHCDDGYVHLIADEGPGVPDPIYEAAYGSMAGPRVLLLTAGNPIKTSGFFYDAGRNSLDWLVIRVSAIPEDHDPANGVYYSARPGKAFVDSVAADYGRDSNAFRVRCRGLYPKEEADTIVPFEWVEAAVGRKVSTNPDAIRIWALDCARGGGDTSVLGERQQNAFKILGEWAELRDMMLLVGRVKAIWDQTPVHLRPAALCVDVIGIGAGCADRLKEMGLPVIAVNVSELPAIGERYRNLRTELWWKVRLWFEPRDVTIPKHKYLDKELTAARYKVIESNGKILALPKDDMRKHLRGRSPDYADTLMMTFAVSAARAAGLSKHSSKKALRRNWKGVV